MSRRPTQLVTGWLAVSFDSIDYVAHDTARVATLSTRSLRSGCARSKMPATPERVWRAIQEAPAPEPRAPEKRLLPRSALSPIVQNKEPRATVTGLVRP